MLLLTKSSTRLLKMTQTVPQPTDVDRALSVTYCDDVRQEVNNKLSFMGMYQGQLIFPALPARVPRLCVIQQLVCPKVQPFQHAKVAVYRDESLFAESELTPPEDAWTSGREEGYLRFMIPFIFENLEFSQKTIFRVRCTFDDGMIIPAPALEIDAAPGPGAAQHFS
uniref:DUF6941 family protein n=1 Tax=Burkholderia sp. AU33423 TaxID=2015355 RepID=UPI003594348C